MREFKSRVKVVISGREDWDEEPCKYLTFKYWEKGEKHRIYVNDYKNRTLGYIDVDNDYDVNITNLQGISGDSSVPETVDRFFNEYLVEETTERVEETAEESIKEMPYGEYKDIYTDCEAHEYNRSTNTIKVMIPARSDYRVICITHTAEGKIRDEENIKAHSEYGAMKAYARKKGLNIEFDDIDIRPIRLKKTGETGQKVKKGDIELKAVK